MSKVLNLLEGYTKDQVENNIEFFIDQYITEQSGEDEAAIDNAWSIKKEGHLNKNNLIFKKDFPLKRLLKKLKEVNDSIKNKGDHHA